MNESPPWEADSCSDDKFPTFYETEGSVPCSQDPTTGPYPEPVQYIPHADTLFLVSFLILSSHLCLGVPT